MKQMLIDRFLRYVSYETTSDESIETSPTTIGQLVFAQQLKSELEAMGASEVVVDSNGYLTATIPSNSTKNVPSIGFIAHLDTSPDASGKNVLPRIVRYDGSDILLSEQGGKVLAETQFPELGKYRGEDLIVTDGTTLLGADDKAGVAEIMTMAAFFLKNKHIHHGDIHIAFTPDEEIGRGADLLDIKAFGADWAYTVDGGELGELEYENFNAASVEVKFKGIGIHPGYAKDKMINASRLASEYITLLPAKEVPEKTEGYEGFYHLTSMEGTVEEARLKFIIRDHDIDSFNRRKMMMQEIAKRMLQKYEGAEVTCKIKDQYFNMVERIKPVMYVIDIALQAMRNCEVKPVVKPIRGGTDGANLSSKGLPCPNLFAGGLNFHGVYEFVPVNSMLKATEVLIEIAKLAAK